MGNRELVYVLAKVAFAKQALGASPMVSPFDPARQAQAQGPLPANRAPVPVRPNLPATTPPPGANLPAVRPSAPAAPAAAPATPGWGSRLMRGLGIAGATEAIARGVGGLSAAAGDLWGSRGQVEAGPQLAGRVPGVGGESFADRMGGAGRAFAGTTGTDANSPLGTGGAANPFGPLAEMMGGAAADKPSAVSGPAQPRPAPAATTPPKEKPPITQPPPEPPGGPLRYDKAKNQFFMRQGEGYKQGPQWGAQQGGGETAMSTADVYRMLRGGQTQGQAKDMGHKGQVPQQQFGDDIIKQFLSGDPSRAAKWKRMGG